MFVKMENAKADQKARLDELFRKHFPFLKAIEAADGLFSIELLVGGVVHDFGGAVDAILGEVGFDAGEARGLYFFECHNCLK